MSASGALGHKSRGFRRRILFVGVLLAAGLMLLAGTSARSSDQAAHHRSASGGNRLELPPFLEVFESSRTNPVETKRVRWPSATGQATGVLVRRTGEEQLPGLLMLPGHSGQRDWFRQSARELADIGYVVLLVERSEEAWPPVALGKANQGCLDQKVKRERVLANLSAAVRWLRRRSDVFADRMGVIGWAHGGSWAWWLAANMGLQGAVNCGGPLGSQPDLVAGWHHTAVMGLWGGQSLSLPARRRADQLAETLKANGIEHQFQFLEASKAGFMNPQSKTYRPDQADRAWFLIYEFLAEHVEDAHIKRLLARRGLSHGHGHQHDDDPHDQQRAATIADWMRAINSATGLRGRLVRSLNEKPTTKAQWQKSQARAAVLVEAARSLRSYDPPRGSQANWLQEVAAYHQAVQTLHQATQQRDYSAATKALSRIEHRCSQCHSSHR